MSRRHAWFDSIPEATIGLDCDGAQHRVSWRRGKVVLHDHRLAEEAVVSALGGDPPPCIAILQGWRDSRTWAAAVRPHPPGFIRRVAPPAVPDRLASVRRLGVVRAWERQWRARGGYDEAEDLYRLLRKSALPRLADALEVDRAHLGGGPARFVEVRLARPHGRPRVEGRIDATRASVVATLLPDWLYTVGVRAVGARFEVEPGLVVVWKESATGVWEPALAHKGGSGRGTAGIPA